jgi:hypothetical protein
MLQSGNNRKERELMCYVQGEGTPKKLVTTTQPQFLRTVHEYTHTIQGEKMTCLLFHVILVYAKTTSIILELVC